MAERKITGKDISDAAADKFNRFVSSNPRITYIPWRERRSSGDYLGVLRPEAKKAGNPKK